MTTPYVTYKYPGTRLTLVLLLSLILTTFLPWVEVQWLRSQTDISCLLMLLVALMLYGGPADPMAVFASLFAWVFCGSLIVGSMSSKKGYQRGAFGMVLACAGFFFVFPNNVQGGFWMGMLLSCAHLYFVLTLPRYSH